MIREFWASVGDTELEIRVVERDGNVLSLAIGERTVTADAVRIGPNTYSVLVGNRSVVVDIGPETGTQVVRAGASRAETEIMGARRRRLEAAAKRSNDTAKVGGDICAPIAGKVVKLLVAVGDEVEVGTPVAVLEAMKMENEIKADRSGVAKTVHVADGDSVETRQPLISLGEPG